MEYRILNQDGHGICPKCAGLLARKEPLLMVCFDCKAMFKAIDMGIFDSELIYEEVILGGEDD